MIAACGVFGMTLSSASISMKDVWRVRVPSRRSLGSMFATRERCLLLWLPFELEPMPMAESAARRALDSEAASCILTCFLCSSLRCRWDAISRSREASVGRTVLPATAARAWAHPSLLRWMTWPLLSPSGGGDWLLLFSLFRSCGLGVGLGGGLGVCCFTSAWMTTAHW